MFEWCLEVCVINVLCDVCTMCVFVICMLVGMCGSVCDVRYVFSVVCV